MILRAIDDPGLVGPVNATSPNPVRNGELTDVLSEVFGRHARLRVPAGVLRLGLGAGAANELLLASQRVLPSKLTEAGYVHVHPELAGALAAALR